MASLAKDDLLKLTSSYYAGRARERRKEARHALIHASSMASVTWHGESYSVPTPCLVCMPVTV